MKVRKVVAESVSLYLRHARRLVPPALVLAAVPACPILIVPGPIGEGIAAVLALPLVFVLQALHVVESAEARIGEPRPIWKSARELRPVLKPLVLMTLLACVKMVVYFAIFAVAEYEAIAHRNLGWVVAILVVAFVGLVCLVARWSLLVPVIVLEGVGARKAFRRCGKLVGRHVLGVSLVLLFGSIVYGIVDVVALLAIRASVSGETGRAFAEKVVSEPLTAPFLALLGTSAYFALREDRDQAAVRPGMSRLNVSTAM